MERADQDRLVHALDELADAIRKAVDAPEAQKSGALSLVEDAKDAVTAEPRSGPRIFGLLSGIGQAVQTIGTAREAWSTLKAAAAAIGMMLS